MALYLGNSKKLKMVTPNGTYRLYIPTLIPSAPNTSGVILKSFDGYNLEERDVG